MTKEIGLDAAGFLLLAEGHLRKAREVNARTTQTELVEEAEKYMDYADSWLQYAIQTLKAREGEAMQQAIEELEKALRHLEKGRELLSEQIAKPGEETPGYQTGWAIHWAKGEIRKLRRQEKEE